MLVSVLVVFGVNARCLSLCYYLKVLRPYNTLTRTTQPLGHIDFYPAGGEHQVPVPQARLVLTVLSSLGAPRRA